MIHSEFTFFKAGQGAFYGGHIYSFDLDRTFNVVYDCGTTSFIKGNWRSLRDEITKFKARPERHGQDPTIDLLFISHLDYDHVSGLKILFEEFNVKRIILPYIDKQSRWVFVASYAGEDDSPDQQMNESDYSLFLDNPLSFIQELGGEPDVFFVDPASQSEEYLGYDTNDQSDDIVPRGTLAGKTSNDELKSSGDNVFLYENNLQFFIRNQWEFTTYVKEVNDKAIDALAECLSKLTKSKKETDLGLNDLKQILTSHRSDAHQCYKKKIGEINTHGLVLLHGPMNFGFADIFVDGDNEISNEYPWRSYFFNEFAHYSATRRTGFLGTLLLGDTSLKPSNNSVSFNQPFLEKLPHVHIFQVPHHGASKNWDKEEFDNLRIGASLIWEHQITAVCNFGYGNTYGHPSHQVIEDLRARIFLNSQFSSLRVQYDIH